MIVVLIILSLGLLGVIIYFAVSPKSSRLLRLSAIIALGVICLALVICGIIIIIGPAEDPNAIEFPIFPDSPPAPKRVTPISDIVILAILLFVIGFIITKAMKERRKTPAAPKKAEKSQIFQDTDELDIDQLDNGLEKKEEDESFDIEL